MNTQKSYLYKVYSAAGVYIGVWPSSEIINEFALSEEINTAASQLQVLLGRPVDNFGEGYDVADDLLVKVYVIDADAPNGALAFQGYVSSYKPVYGNDEHIEINCWGHGARLDGYSLEEAIATNPFFDTSAAPSHNGSYLGGTWWYAQSFDVSAGTAITKLKSYIAWDDFLYPHPPAVTGTLECGIFTDSSGKPGTLIGSYAPLNASLEFDFSAILPAVNPIFKYWAVFRATGASTQGWLMTESLYNYDPANSAAFSPNSGTSWSAYAVNDLPLQIWNNATDTTISYNSMDPSEILMDALDRAALKGSPLTYTGSTIELTGTVVTYEFNSNTIWEAAKKCIELAPAGWYLYIDQANNEVHFHKKNNSVDLPLVIGRDFIDLQPEKRTEDIVNTILFTGKDGLFLKFQDKDSFEERGEVAKKYIDQRVSRVDTATTMAQAVLEQVRGGEVRFSPLKIIDNNIDATKGKNIEAIIIGMTVGVRNVAGRGPSLYNVSYYNEDYYNFNMADLSSPIVQIVRLERTPNDVTIFCSTIPPDVAKRIEDINRNLEASQTAANPTAPDVVA